MTDVEELISWLRVSGWIAGIAALPTIGWAITVQVQMMRIREETKKLLEMHQRPDEFGFGTVTTNSAIAKAQRETTQCIKDNTIAIEQLTHYLRWQTKEIHGISPPPQLPSDGQ